MNTSNNLYFEWTHNKAQHFEFNFIKSLNLQKMEKTVKNFLINSEYRTHTKQKRNEIDINRKKFMPALIKIHTHQNVLSVNKS